MVGRVSLAAILLLYGIVSVVGITWGLPSRDIDRYLFGDGEPWTGEEIARLARAHEKAGTARGADVDVDPLDETDEPIRLTGTDEQAAAIYLRYRLYTYQPDEMITMMALAQMRPGAFDFDPRLYQYGGLFIYPVGALIKLCGLVGLIDVRSDLTYYLDHPDEFGKFYVAARAYVAVWGLVGVVAVYLIACRLQDRRVGMMAALLFAILPVVVCMSHEAKPHLCGAALMLLAVLLAMHYTDSGKRGHWLGLCVACGAALGTVLSSLPIFVLVPLAELIRWHRGRTSRRVAVKRTAIGLGVAVGVYAITNPYVPINLIANRAVLGSNFGNSLAMYEIDRLGEGFVRMASLTAEGATLPVLVIGLVGMVLLIRAKRWTVAPLAVPAGLIFVQFVLIGAGKPAEYGRFGVFANAALAICAAWLVGDCRVQRRSLAGWVIVPLVVIWVGTSSFRYVENFWIDARRYNTRVLSVPELDGTEPPVGLLAEPAPYCCPPLDFAQRKVWLYPSVESWRDHVAASDLPDIPAAPRVLITTMDYRPSAFPNGWVLLPSTPRPLALSPISWANKPIYARRAR